VGTAEMLLIRAKQVFKISDFELEDLIKKYKSFVDKY